MAAAGAWLGHNSGMSTPVLPPTPEIVLVAAVARNGGIGRNNQLLWHDPADQKHFRAVTLGAPVLMGRKTWDSLPARFRPLPGRQNVVLTRDPQWQADGALRAGSIDQALAMTAGAERLSVIGGGEIYRLVLPLADTLLLTEIDADLDADAYFPPWSATDFIETDRVAHTSAQGVRFSFVTHRRRAVAGAAAPSRA